jgi:DNA topoisomerase-3
VLFDHQFKGIYRKALARAAGDLIYGMSMTRAYTIEGRKNGYRGVLSVGRVQTPILGLIVRRYLANQSHTSSFYYQIIGDFSVNGQTFAANWKVNENAPPLPFNLVRLQQTMNRQHKMTAARTLEITQQLREKYKAITYNRSDCSYLSDEQFNDAPLVLDALRGIDDFNGLALDRSRKSKAFDSGKVTAHTAIIPILPTYRH